MSVDYVRERCGLPNLTRKLRGGEPVHIVAYGTSLTIHGYYLAALSEMLTARFPGARVRVTNVGLQGFTSEQGAFRVEHDVLPLAPDLLILEFAHNDTTIVARIPAALEGIITQLHDAQPACDVLFLYFALSGMRVDQTTAAMRMHETVADRHGFPSVDLSGFAERLVADGTAVWSGGERALTTDGVHYSPLTAELFGIPFAEAVVRIAEEQRFAETVAGFAEEERSPYARARRVALPRHLANGPWSVGDVTEELHAIRNAQAYVDKLCQAGAPGASLRVRFTGRGAMLWALALGGELESTIDGRAERIPIPPKGAGLRWSLLSLRRVEHRDDFNHVMNLPEGPHVLEIRALTVPLVLGDLFIIGEPAEAAK